MALNLKTLATRSLSALVFVILLVACVYVNYYTFSMFFLIVAMLGLNEFYGIAEKIGLRPMRLPGFITAVFLYLIFFNFTFCEPECAVKTKRILSGLLYASPFLIFALALFGKRENIIKDTVYTMGGVIYTVLPFALLNQTVFYSGPRETGGSFEPLLVLGIIFLIWSNDTFAYFGGSIFGKNKLMERVSPGKTWEGTITGVLVTLALSFGFNKLVFELETGTWPLLGICIPVLATVGDLVESKLKREAGVKDSGNIMPGHGGILDRFDSLIFVSPFVYLLFQCVKS